ncbi:MAG: response regulator [Clostridiales bacterium]|nr:response regulator [Clostridiales bacterium]
MTVLIADDNLLIRNWLKIMLRQLEGDRLEILEASDGDEAFSLCQKQHVDLVIADIRMPGMDGISLIRALQEKSPATQTAVLSSYDDFSYVREALRCGALDYIPKAQMQQDDIVSLLKKARERIHLSQGSTSQLSQYAQSIREAAEAFRHFQQTGDEDAPGLLNACGLAGDSRDLSLTLMYIRRSSAQAGEETAASVCCHVLRELELDGIAIPIEDSLYLLIFAVPGDLAVSLEELHTRLLSSLKQSLETSQEGELEKNVSAAFPPSESLTGKLRLLRNLLDFQVYYDCAALPPADGSDQKAGSRFFERFQSQLSHNHPEPACQLLQEYILECHNRREMPHRIRRTMTAACHIMLTAIPESGQKSDAFHQLERLSQNIGSLHTSDQMTRAIHRCCDICCDLAGSEKKYSPSIRQAMDYCGVHYAEKVSLEAVAAYVHLNRTYFSHLFHKETGTPFRDYLEQIRIQNACRLLSGSALSMSEIAEQVGFANQNYFTKVFKNTMGVTPSQYRNAQ